MLSTEKIHSSGTTRRTIEVVCRKGRWSSAVASCWRNEKRNITFYVNFSATSFPSLETQGLIMGQRRNWGSLPFLPALLALHCHFSSRPSVQFTPSSAPVSLRTPLSLTRKKHLQYFLDCMVIKPSWKIPFVDQADLALAGVCTLSYPSHPRYPFLQCWTAEAGQGLTW